MIVGAGLAGLICAHAMPQERVIEIQPEPNEVHKALLRFRTPSVGELTGIEFKPVEVRKGIWMDGQFHDPSILTANLYAKKVVGRIHDRSIWDISTVTRYIAPQNFYERLIDSVGKRISWGTDWARAQLDVPPQEPIISTAPLPAMLDAFGIDIGEKFARKSIHVQRWHVEDCDVYQTIYFPSPKHSLYRASITGDLLIAEFAGLPVGDWGDDMMRALGIWWDITERLGTADQKYGKIAPIHDGARRAAIAKLTTDHNVFSVGRFATWRNILLDDVVHDIAVVKRLISSSEYDRKLTAAK